MNTRDVTSALTTLFDELVDGAPTSGGYMLNPGDEGMLRSLDRLDAASASALTQTGSSIAAHVDHVRYGLSLLNRWSAGERPDPAETADWTASWRKTTVSEAGWTELRAQLRQEASRWRDALSAAREISQPELNAIIASIAHLAYHLGAIRQIDRAARGPAEGSQPS